MRKLIFALFFASSASVYPQIEPVVTYDGGDLYFVPAKLTSDGVPFMYSYRDDSESGKIWFSIFDDEAKVVKQAEIDAETLSYTTRTITSVRRFFVKDPNGGTRTAASASEEGYFLDDWVVESDVTVDKSERNMWIEAPEVYEDNNNYHSRFMYLSQTLFDSDEEFEFLRAHYEVMPLTYCAADDKTGNEVTMARPVIGGEECDGYDRYYDHDLRGWVYVLFRTKVYGGVKNTGMDVVSLDGNVKKTLVGITSLGTVVAINGNYYVSAYDNKSSKYGLYKIARATTGLSKIADISAKTANGNMYNLSGIRVKAGGKGLVVKDGRKVYTQ